MNLNGMKLKNLLVKLKQVARILNNKHTTAVTTSKAKVLNVFRF